MGTFIESGKDNANKAVKGGVWDPPFFSCAKDTVGLYPTAPTAIRLWKTFTFLYPAPPSRKVNEKAQFPHLP